MKTKTINTIFTFYSKKYKVKSIFKTIIFLFIVLFCSVLHAQKSDSWANKQLQKLSLEQKIAQLTMIRIHAGYEQSLLDTIYQQIIRYQPGGVCFFQGNPTKEVVLTNQYQSISKIPLLISMDAEWGPAMRLDSCTVFPRQMALGALPLSENDLLYQMGQEIGKQCNVLGIHINFAPCVDVNNNPLNPVINSRSFGEDREWVAQKAISYMQGMQSRGVSACAKHFPGHGDTQTDSHLDLPVINKSRQELENLEFYPFRKIIEQGVDMVMVSHLNIPSLDAEPNSISTLSQQTITGILRNEMAFKGLIITDAMDMKGLRKSYPKGGEAEIKALLAGVDILLLPNELSIVIPAIKEAVEQGRIAESLINEKCLKVLKLKEEKGLDTVEMLPTKKLQERLDSQEAKDLVNKLSEKSLTLLKNKNQLLPLKNMNKKQTALVCIGNMQDSAIIREIAASYPVTLFHTDRKVNIAALTKSLNTFQTVIVAVLGTNQLPKYNYGVYKETIQFINELSHPEQLILSFQGNPYALEQLSGLSKMQAILVGYQPTMPVFQASLRALFGEIGVNGKLPVKIETYKLHGGLLLPDPLPTASFVSKLSEKHLKQIDSIVNQCIKQKIFPGCQILAIHHDSLILKKNYGYQTYQNQVKIDDEQLYDLASMTKSLATTLAIMKLYEENELDMNDQIGKFLPFLKHTDKENLTIAELLTHTAGLPAFIPFYKELVKNGIFDTTYLSNVEKENFYTQIAQNMYLKDNYKDTVLSRIAHCKLGYKSYLYSDLGFILLKEIVEKITKMPMDLYLEMNFYTPMNLRHSCFNPYNQHIELSNIAPTEQDNYFRMQLIQGFVHDQSAALFGGVCGNAGLFSNASDIAVILQMLMNKGKYNNVHYLKSETVKLFTNTYSLHRCHRRALGFDTPSFEHPSSVLPAKAGKHTFGHQGFTGTVFWCDPDNELIYIFLSNRVYPNSEPNNLAKNNIRRLIHDIIYEDIK